MSLEQKIETLTASIDKLIGVLSTTPATAPKADKPAPAATKADKPKAESKKTKDDDIPPSTHKPSDQEIAVAKAKAASEAAADLDYKRDVAPKVLEVVSVCGHDEATAILQRLGVATAKQLLPNAWPELIRLCEESLAGHSAKDAEPEDENEGVV